MPDLGIDLEDSDMSIAQVEQFIAQVRNGPARVQRITLIGGEPLLHPEVVRITRLLHDELLEPMCISELRLVSNLILPVPEEINQWASM